MQVGLRILRTALIAGSALGLTAGGSVLALASGPAAQASTTCAAAWSSTAVYTAGNQASEDGINYTANWWTQGNDPATSNGDVVGSTAVVDRAIVNHRGEVPAGS